jgi:dihydrofolate synthase/folylpolyglutamate synthase
LPKNNSLGRWLERLEQMQPDRIELGLQRIRTVASRCDLLNPTFDILTVAGTNGKGSTVAYAASILRHSRYRVGVYTSPHFVDFNERIAIDEQRVSDEQLCEAFAAIDAQRDGTDLTYFEFTTLAAMFVFQRSSIDVAVLEVGLGGRLDAVNAWDCSVGCITSIGIDHSDWLGDDRESIGREKAGIARRGLPLICGDREMPSSIAKVAAETGATLIRIGHDFDYRIGAPRWQYRGPAGELDLPVPSIDGDWAMGNASVAVTACAALLQRLPATEAVERAVREVIVPGRMQRVIYRQVPLLLDVAHNPQAAAALARHLGRQSMTTMAVFSCLQDKDAAGVVAELAGVVDRWLIFPLDYPRAHDIPSLVEMINAQGASEVEVFTSVIQALDAAVAQFSEESRIIVFGSFHVVGPVLQMLEPTD